MFKFRLEKVLQHRRRQVDACSRAVSAAEQELSRAEVALDDVRSAIQRHDAAAADARRGHLNPDGLQQQLAWRGRLVQSLTACERGRDEAREAMTRAQKALQEAWRDREVLDRLRAKQQEDWRYQQARRDQRELDEVGSIRAAIGSAQAGWSQAAGDEFIDGKRQT